MHTFSGGSTAGAACACGCATGAATAGAGAGSAPAEDSNGLQQRESNEIWSVIARSRIRTEDGRASVRVSPAVISRCGLDGPRAEYVRRLSCKQPHADLQTGIDWDVHATRRTTRGSVQASRTPLIRRKACRTHALIEMLCGRMLYRQRRGIIRRAAGTDQSRLR